MLCNVTLCYVMLCLQISPMHQMNKTILVKMRISYPFSQCLQHFNSMVPGTLAVLCCKTANVQSKDLAG